jgi:hypothetical protein
MDFGRLLTCYFLGCNIMILVSNFQFVTNNGGSSRTLFRENVPLKSLLLMTRVSLTPIIL